MGITGMHLIRRHHLMIIKISHQQSVGSTGNGVSLSGLTEFAPQFES